MVHVGHQGSRHGGRARLMAAHQRQVARALFYQPLCHYQPHSSHSTGDQISGIAADGDWFGRGRLDHLAYATPAVIPQET